VDAERGYSEDRWYADDRGYPEPDRRDSWRGGAPGYDDRMPPQRGYPEQPSFPGFTPPGYAEPAYSGPHDPGFDPRVAAAPTSGDPRSGGNLYGPRAERAQPALEPAPAQRSERGTRSADDGVYRSRKPLHAAGLAVFLGIFELLMLIRFGRGITDPDMHGLLAGGLMLMALPAFGLGFYALITGAAHGGPKAFLKAPLAYLPVGLILMVAAGAAA
jgi:hypothetical protein